MLSIINRMLPDFGVTYGPVGRGPFPGLIVLHGSEGGWAGWSHRIAMFFAAHGFLTYAHAYSKGGNPWNAGSISEVPLDDTVLALNALRGLPECSGKVGIYGASRGAEHALLVTSLMARDGMAGLPEAVAVHSPADVICGAFDAATCRESGDPGWQAWDPGARAWCWRGSSQGLKPTTPIEIERYAGPLFLSHGVLDQMWSVEMTRRLEARLRPRLAPLEVHYYEGEGHICMNESENEHNRLLLAFFNQHLRNR